ncbi:MAG TPA: hypothetical protein VK514_09310, partial [Candidatus Acidoferrum sp.]|nr:hypothetical protein [Candidatus Acidoferrum sp.]
MPTLRFRPRLEATRHVVGIVVIVAVAVALGSDSFARQQENPNRPPWAQKNKPADVAATSTPKADTPDPAQDRGKIKVAVNLVNVLVSVLDEHNRP